MSKTRRSITNGYANLVIGKEKKEKEELPLKLIVQGRTLNQKKYLKNIHNSDITFCTGPAGSGKTHLAVGAAATYLARHVIDRIVIIRPAISCDEELGALPGDLLEKLNPYLRPVFDELLEFFTPEQLTLLTSGRYPIIEGAALGMIKGRTFKRSIVILDEAQDATYKQIKNVLTRIGERSKIIINGDITQSDKFCSYDNKIPLEEVILRLKDCEGIGFSTLELSDIQRHPRIAHILEKL